MLCTEATAEINGYTGVRTAQKKKLECEVKNYDK